MPNLYIRHALSITPTDRIAQELISVISRKLNCEPHDIKVLWQPYSAKDINTGVLDIELEALPGEGDERLSLSAPLSKELSKVGTTLLVEKSVNVKATAWVKIYKGGSFAG